jgi:hypothetical protein
LRIIRMILIGEFRQDTITSLLITAK